MDYFIVLCVWVLIGGLSYWAGSVQAEKRSQVLAASNVYYIKIDGAWHRKSF